MIQTLENFHSTGYIHLDIKFDNILVSEQNEIVLIDYGCARKFELEDGTHIPNSGAMEGGNPHFASKNAFKEQTLSRRDDLIQVLYNLMALQNSFAPLQRLLGDDEHYHRFMNFKRNADAEDFCSAN